ncbi:hypothetical protein Tco_1150653 [Tanacetum coccineum]
MSAKEVFSEFALTHQNGTCICEDHGRQDPVTYRYKFKAAVTDGTATIIRRSTNRNFNILGLDLNYSQSTLLFVQKYLVLKWDSRCSNLLFPFGYPTNATLNGMDSILLRRSLSIPAWLETLWRMRDAKFERYPKRIMSITKEQQQALDDALVPQEQHLRIGNCSYKLSTTLKPKEPTFQVALDVLSLTPFYQAFLIPADVPAIYMHEFWATVCYHKHNIKFKMNKKNYSFDLETFKDMLQICPNLPRQKFVDPPFEEEILAFIRELGYSGNVKSLSDIKETSKPKYVRRSTRENSEQTLTASLGKTLKATAKVAKTGNKKLPTQGLVTLSEIALSEAEQMKIVTKRSKT